MRVFPLKSYFYMISWCVNGLVMDTFSFCNNSHSSFSTKLSIKSPQVYSAFTFIHFCFLNSLSTSFREDISGLGHRLGSGIDSHLSVMFQMGVKFTLILWQTHLALSSRHITPCHEGDIPGPSESDQPVSCTESQSGGFRSRWISIYCIPRLQTYQTVCLFFFEVIRQRCELE